MPGPGPAKFIGQALKLRSMSRWNKRKLAEVLVTLPDPSVIPVIKGLLGNTGVRDTDTRSKLMGRILE